MELRWLRMGLPGHLSNGPAGVRAAGNGDSVAAFGSPDQHQVPGAIHQVQVRPLGRRQPAALPDGVGGLSSWPVTGSSRACWMPTSPAVKLIAFHVR